MLFFLSVLTPTTLFVSHISHDYDRQSLTTINHTCYTKSSIWFGQPHTQIAHRFVTFVIPCRPSMRLVGIYLLCSPTPCVFNVKNKLFWWNLMLLMPKFSFLSFCNMCQILHFLFILEMWVFHYITFWLKKQNLFIQPS